MFSPKLLLIARVSAVIGLAGLLIFIFHFAAEGQGRTVLANAPAFEDTVYPPPEPTQAGSGSDSGYPAAETETAAARITPSKQPSQATQATPSKSSTPGPNSTSLFTPTITLSPTLPPDQFRTEDSEMNGSLTTPVMTDTPGPTITGYVTPTATKTKLQPMPTQVTAKKKDGISIDWGLFWIGFSLPVLGGCGGVLYLLDRRPEIFRRRH